MQFDVLRAGRRAGQRHVVEWRQEHAAVEQVEVQAGLDQAVACVVGLAAVARGVGHEQVLDARADARHVPGQAQFLERRADARLELRGELEHMPIGVLRHHFGEGRAHRRQLQRVAGQGAAKAEMVDRLPRSEVRQYRPDPLRLRLAASPDGAGNAAGDAFAEDEEVRLEAMRAAIAGGTAGDGVGLVDDQRHVVAAGQFAQAGVEAFGRRDHADVGHEGFGEHRGDVAMGEGGLQRVEVVELHQAGGGVVAYAIGVNARARNHAPGGVEFHLRFVDAAVVVAVEHHHLVTSAEHPAQAQDETVGVGGRGGHLPIGQAEAPRQFGADPQAVLGRQHQGGAAPRLAGVGVGHRRLGVAEHGAAIAEGEVDVLLAVDVGDARALGLFHQQRAVARPLLHPVQRCAVQPVAAVFPVGLGGARMQFVEASQLALEQRFDAGQVEAEGGVHGRPHGSWGVWLSTWARAPTGKLTGVAKSSSW